MEEKCVQLNTETAVTKEVYTVKEIAKILGMKERSAYAYCNNTTDFRVVKLGRLLRIHKQSFDDWWNG